MSVMRKEKAIEKHAEVCLGYHISFFFVKVKKQKTKEASCQVCSTVMRHSLQRFCKHAVDRGGPKAGLAKNVDVFWMCGGCSREGAVTDASFGASAVRHYALKLRVWKEKAARNKKPDWSGLGVGLERPLEATVKMVCCEV